MRSKVLENLSLEEIVLGIKNFDYVILSQVLSLIENKKSDKKKLLGQIIDRLRLTQRNSEAGKVIGITGPPGAGKSTLIESLGLHVLNKNPDAKLAVLSVDPSSHISGGSILGDKTRMNNLAQNPKAFLRPFASSSALGGVFAGIQDAVFILSSLGFDPIIIETVGIGQSEWEVKEVCDFLILVAVASLGDDLQGIKRGVMEECEQVVINKMDELSKAQLDHLIHQFSFTLSLFPRQYSFWPKKVLGVSALNHQGIDNLWKDIQTFYEKAETDPELNLKRQKRQFYWPWNKIEGRIESVLEDLKNSNSIQQILKSFQLNPQITLNQTEKSLMKQVLGQLREMDS